MMAGLLASLWQLPFLICSCVLGGLAIWGWRRTGMTGALLIAVACGIRVMDELVAGWHMMRLYSGAAQWRLSIWFGAFERFGALIADVLLIVGVALLLRRLPRKP
jgi:hypothetical protein